MRNFLIKHCWVVALIGLAPQAVGQQLKQDSTLYNRSSYRGMPLVDESGNPIDRDYVVIENTGSVTYRAPTISEQELANRTTSPPTAGQFRSFIVNGSFLATTQIDKNEVEIKVVDGQGNYRLRSATIAASYIARASVYQFGDIIAAPTKSELGGDVEDPEDYWFRQPYEDSESYSESQTSLGYYWSPHAQEVFAVQSGNIQISWKKRELASSGDEQFSKIEGSEYRYQLGDGSDGLEYINDDGTNNFYVLHTETYIIAGTANKTPQLVYWNNSDDYNGPEISIDRGVVGDLVFIYTDSFPETVVTGTEIDSITQEEVDINDPTILVEKNGGIWQVKAQNFEGRIFAEVLGDPKGDGTKVFLGYEIVDVVDVAIPELLEVELGEMLITGANSEPEGGLFPQPVNLVSSLEFAYRQVIDGTDIPVLWATKLTENTSDIEIHWMAEGIEGIRWPYQYSRYQFIWPADYSKYSHYIRPSSNDNDAAELSSILIPSEMVPIIEEQDIIEGGGAFIGEDTRFYTIVTEDDPVHRTLLRYNSRNEVAFERVLSWRTDELKQMEEVALSHSVIHLDGGYLDGVGEFSNIAAPRFIELDGNTLYVANRESLNESKGQDSVMALDLSDLSSINELFTIYDNSNFLYSIADPASIKVQDNILLIPSSGDSNLYGVNVEDLDSPAYSFRLRDNSSMTSMAGPTSAFLDGDYLYVTAAAERSLGIVDLTSIESLNVITRKTELVATSLDSNEVEFGFGLPSDILVVDEIAYLADAGNDTIYVLDVSTPLKPVILQKITNQDAGFENLDGPWSLLHDGDNLFATCNGSNTVLIMSIADRQNPVVISQVEHLVNGYEGLYKAQQMSFADGVLAVSGRESGMVTLIDVSTPSSPVLIEEFTEADYEYEIPGDVAFNGELLIISGELLIISGERSDNIVVIEWQDPRIKHWNASEFAGSIAAELDVFDSEYLVFDWDDEIKAPRYIEETVYVGDRISPPVDQAIINSDYEDYLAGYINQNSGTSFNPNAYVNPLDSLTSIEDANLGSIIPVNAIPGDNLLEVWWMRENGANEAEGFKTVLWPSVIGHYTLAWPEDSDEIVLASDNGSGALSSLLASGSIYYENTPGAVGYNPNEEHALMSGGQAFALRDDLNLTDDLVDNPDGQYSSEPFVLLQYIADDGRPSVKPYKVLREKPEEGLTFNTLVEAALEVIQPPMPLPLLGVPLYEDATSFEETLNREVGATWIESNTIDDSDPSVDPIVITTVAEHALTSGEFYVLEGDDIGTEELLPTLGALIVSVTDNLNFEAYIGSSELIPVVHRQFCKWRINGTANNPIEQVEAFEVEDRDWGTNGSTQILFYSATEERFEVYTLIDSSENRVFLRMPDGLTANGFPEAEYAMILEDTSSLDLANWTVSRSVIPRSSREISSDKDALYSGFTFTDRKGGVWAYRGPHDATVGAITGEGFDMQYHYATQTGFAFPSSDEEIPVGTLTPYLRKLGDNGYLGDPIYVEEYSGGLTQSAPISYLPYWATDVPELKTGKTLTSAFNRIDGIRGNSSAEILYDQSLALNELNQDMQSAVLHDPTREKRAYLGVDTTLSEIPTTVATVNYLGDEFFPSLPPHLSERFFYNPDLGDFGALVFKGEFHEHSEDYIMPNIIGAGDLEDLRELVDENDELVDEWYDAIEALTTTMERFVEENGVYVVSADSDGFNYSIGFDEVARVDDDDIAVDSYAITAMGPGTGYVTVLTGNGNAFTDPNDPVGMFVFKVVNDLHTGLLVDVPSDNPLSEKLTMQQVVDLSGSAVGDFVFEWKIAAPSGDVAPLIANEDVVTALLGSDGWSHVAFPAYSDNFSAILAADDRRKSSVSLGRLEALSSLDPSGWSVIADDGNSGTHESDFTLLFSEVHGLEVGELIAFDNGSDWIVYRVDAVTASGANVEISQYDSDQDGLSNLDDLPLKEFSEVGIADSVVHQSFTTESDTFVNGLWLGLSLSSHLGAEVYINGEKVVVEAMNGIDSAYSDTQTASPPEDSVAKSFSNSYFIDPSVLDQGTLDGAIWTHDMVVNIYAYDTASLDTEHIFDLALEMAEYEEIVDEEGWLDLESIRYPDGIRAILGGTANVQALSDNYLIMRYGQVDTEDFDNDGDTTEIIRYSKWTDSILAEGWIKRVLDGINPFDQRVTDLFNNAIETDASILTLAGPRWEGNVALNSDSINDFGLIEIYETVLNRGKGLSIDSGINYGPANDALLLAAGYLNDLYMMLGNEAWADALNPTIGISTADGALGDVATSSFAFQGQSASLLDEELSLLRGRDDFLPPGVEASPVYNRLFWNYTRGIDSGEIIYALNYNIQEDQDDAVDGIIDAADAQIMYPQGHGDAYGHYLTAIKNYFKLLLDEDFDWVPRTEAVLILGQTVQVDYTDERKFATAASALAEAGSQIVDLTWRQDFESGDQVGWDHFGEDAIRDNVTRATARYWGLDHWSTRVAQGTYINWVVGNSMLEEVDSDTSHEGIQVVDRQTVPELKELTYLAESVQVSMDSAEAHLNPLGLTEGSVPFDIKPISTFDVDPNGSRTHFEQIYDRAVAALQNAVVAFDGAKDVTALMRSEDDSLAELQADVDRQELAYKNELIEIYGTPYADDIGVGVTYVTDYDGPDLINYNMVDLNELTIPNWITPEEDKDFTVSSIVDAAQNPFAETYQTIVDNDLSDLNGVEAILNDIYGNGALDVGEDTDGDGVIDLVHGEDFYTLNNHGFFDKPNDWGSRESPGEIQSAIGQIILATNDLRETLENYSALTYKFQRELELFLASVKTHDEIRDINTTLNLISYEYELAMLYYEFVSFILKERVELSSEGVEAIKEGVPNSTIVGLAAGGDLASGARAALKTQGFLVETTASGLEIANFALNNVAARALNQVQTWVPFDEIAPREWEESQRQSIFDLDMSLGDVQMSIFSINNKIQKLGAAKSKYKSLVAKGNRIQAEREVFRQRAAAVTQGFRTRDAAFRVFRDEKLERYKSLFNLAARFAFMSAQAYDYETGLLYTDEGREFIDRIVASRALGVVENGSPQFAGSNTGDPGLSSVLAEMNADWQVLRGRLGHNNPDTEKTTVSLRTENFRILPGSDGDSEWQDVLYGSWVEDLRTDEDLVRHCLQLDDGDGFAVPGLVIEFSTTITKGLNLFGQSLAGGDHFYSPTSYATKIFSVGVAFEGYQGIDDPSANASTTGSSSVADPDASFLDPNYLSATPYVYLIPVGLDAMRSPPLGDESVIRTWDVEDLTIPLPFNIGASDFSSKPLYQSSDSLTEDLFGIRKHQAFRAVGSVDAFPDNGRLMSSVYTNTRLTGRSVWNTHWKLVIPGWALLNDEDQGLKVFIDTVNDIKLNFETMSYSGN